MPVVILNFLAAIIQAFAAFHNFSAGHTLAGALFLIATIIFAFIAGVATSRIT